MSTTLYEVQRTKVVEVLCRHMNKNEWEMASTLTIQNPWLASMVISKDEGRLPLHIALSIGVKGFASHSSKVLHAYGDFISLLVLNHRMGLQTPDKDGNLPIHLATMNHTSNTTLVAMLAKLNPDGMKHMNNEGCLPIHVAATGRGNFPTNLFFELVDVHVVGARVSDKKGNLPIHLAATNTFMDAAVVIRLAEIFPEGLKQKNHEGSLPIHLAATRSEKDVASTNIFDKFVNLYGEGLQISNKEGNLPIHLATGNSCLDEAMVITLAMFCPNALQHKNKEGRLPLHIAATRKGKTTANIFDKLVELYDVGLKISDNKGDLPIHLAAANPYLDEAAVIDLVELYPTGIRRKNNDEILPIHAAAMTCRSDHVKLCKYLWEQYPDGLNQTDKLGNLPIHLAARCRCKLVCAFAKQNPETLRKANHAGNLPLHEATLNEAHTESESLHLLNVLIEAYPEGLEHKGESGLTPLEIAATKSLGSKMHLFVQHRPQALLATNERGENPITLYLNGGTKKPRYMIGHLTECFKVYHTYSKQAAKDEIETYKKTIASLTEEMNALKESRTAIQETLQDVQEESGSINTSFAMAKRFVAQVRLSEHALLPLLMSCDSMDIFKSVASSLSARIDELQGLNNKRALAQTLLSYLLKDPEASTESFQVLIGNLHEDLSDLERKWFKETGDKREHGSLESDKNEIDNYEQVKIEAFDSCLDLPEPNKKRARIAFSPKEECIH